MQKWILNFIFERYIIEAIKKSSNLFIHNDTFIIKS